MVPLFLIFRYLLQPSYSLLYTVEVKGTGFYVDPKKCFDLSKVLVTITVIFFEVVNLDHGLQVQENFYLPRRYNLLYYFILTLFRRPEILRT